MKKMQPTLDARERKRREAGEIHFHRTVRRNLRLCSTRLRLTCSNLIVLVSLSGRFRA